jgi:hypothetical protein
LQIYTQEGRRGSGGGPAQARLRASGTGRGGRTPGRRSAGSRTPPGSDPQTGHRPPFRQALFRARTLHVKCLHMKTIPALMARAATALRKPGHVAVCHLQPSGLIRRPLIRRPWPSNPLHPPSPVVPEALPEVPGGSGHARFALETG